MAMHRIALLGMTCLLLCSIHVRGHRIRLSDNVSEHEQRFLEKSHREFRNKTRAHHHKTRGVKRTLRTLDFHATIDGISRWMVSLQEKGTLAIYSLETLSFLRIVKAICLVSTVMVQLSYYPQVSQIWIQRNTNDIDMMPFVYLTFSSSQWSFYGMYTWWYFGFPKSLVIVSSHCMGIFLGAFYTFTYQLHCQDLQKKGSVQQLHYSVSITIVLLQLVSFKTLHIDQMSVLIGVISMLVSFVAGAYQLTIMPEVKRRRSSAAIRVSLAVATMTSAVFWVIFGILLKDYWIAVPNATTALVSIYVVSYLFVYPREKRNREGSEDYEVFAEARL